MKDNGLPEGLEKRGFIVPGQNQVVVNNNDYYISELGQRVISLDWFLSRDHSTVDQVPAQQINLMA